MPHPQFTPYNLEWMAGLKKSADELIEKKARAVVAAKILRCLGLASADPDHWESYAIEVNLDPELMKEVLSTDAGARLGLMIEGQLRSSGELDRVLTSWAMPEALAVIKRGIAGESVSVALKVIETGGKQNQRGGDENREVTAALPRFEGSADDLIAWLTDSAPSRGSLPFKEPRDA